MVKRIISFLAALTFLSNLLAGLGREGTEVQKVYAAEDTCYVLSVATGTNAGTKVVYIGVMYTDIDGFERTHIITPNDGDFAASIELANSYGDSAGLKKRDQMKKLYGIKLPEMNSVPLAAHSVDDYIFKLEYPLKEVNGFEFYLNGGGYWTCDSMSLYEVKNPNENIKGYDMKGYLSNFYYVDFEGTLLAQISYGESFGSIIKNDRDGGAATFVRNYTREYSLEHGINVSNTSKNVKNYMTTIEGGNKVELPEESRPAHPKNTTYGVELDFSSMPGSGLKGFVQAYNDCLAINCGYSEGIMMYKDPLLLEITYEDVGETKQVIYAPVMLSMACYLNDIGLGSKTVFGFAQSGDSLVFPVTLPGYVPKTDNGIIVNTPEIRLVYNDEYLDKRMQQTTAGSELAASGSIYGSAMKSVGTDAIRLTGFQIYDYMPQLSVNEIEHRLVINAPKDPIWSYAADSEGLLIEREDNPKSTVNPIYLSKLMRVWTTGMTRTSRTNVNSSYYCELDISAEEGSATLNDIEISFQYINNKGKDCSTSVMSLSTLVQEFYGYWPSNSSSGNAYTLNQVDGGKLKFMINVKDVRKFTGVKLSVQKDVSEKDHFQMAGIYVYGIDSIENASGRCRYSYDEDNILIQGLRGSNDCSYWLIDRDVATTSAYVNFAQRQFYSAGESKAFQLGVTANTIIEEEDVDWTKYKNAMTYTDTETDMGYTKVRDTYEVTVKVASDAGNMDNDAGSKNKFYFQLIFESGKKSAYVLANQQLASDGFRSGHEETFMIYTNYDYGMLSGVRIIPDDQQEDTDIYDKLKIDTISVARKTNNGIERKWTCDVYDWVSIDYADSGAYQSLQGRPGRSAAELTRSYPVTSTSYDLAFIVEIDTDGYSDGGAFEGFLKYDIAYYQADSDKLSYRSGDAVQAMADFIGNQPDYEKVVAAGGTTEETSALIDTSTMLREGKTSRFKIKLSKPEKIQSIKLTAIGKNATVWNVSAVRIYKIIGGTGGIFYEDGNVARDYDLLPAASTVGSDGMGSDYALQVLTNQTNSISINFDESGFSYELDVDADLVEWNSLIEEEPCTKDYVVNTYIYLDKNATQSLRPGEYDIIFYLYYTYDSDVAAGRSTSQKVGISGADIDRYYNPDTEAYYMPISLPNVKSIDAITMRLCKRGCAVSGQEIEFDSYPATRLYVDKVVIEQICSDVLIDTYEWQSHTPVDIGIYNESSAKHLLTKRSRNDATYLQRAIVSFGDMTEFDGALKRDSENKEYKDFGIALTYTSKNNPNKELYSITKFLSKMDIDAIRKHQYITVDFHQPEVAEVKGIRVVQQGEGEVYLDAVTVINYSDDPDGITHNAALKGYAGRDILNVINAEHDIGHKQVYQNQYMDIPCDTINAPNQYLTFTFNSGVGLTPSNAIVEAMFTYATKSGGEAAITTSNLADFVQKGNLNTKGEVEISVAMNEYESLHVIQLDPKSSDGGASWTIDSINVTGINTDGTEMLENTIYVNEQLKQRSSLTSDKAFRVNACNIYFDAAVRYIYNGVDRTDNIKSFGKDNDATDENFIKIFVDEGTNVVLNPIEASAIAGDMAKFVKGSFEDIETNLFNVKWAMQGEILSKSDKPLDAQTGADSGNISQIVFKAVNESYTEEANYIIELSSSEVSSRKIRIYVTVDKRKLPADVVYNTATGQYITTDGKRYYNPETGEYTVIDPDIQNFGELISSGNSEDTEDRTEESTGDLTPGSDEENEDNTTKEQNQ